MGKAGLFIQADCCIVGGSNFQKDSFHAKRLSIVQQMIEHLLSQSLA